MERITTHKGFLLINDAWNASPVLMKAAIDTVANLNGYNKKVLVLGDMLELRDQEHKFNEDIANSIDTSLSCTDYGRKTMEVLLFVLLFNLWMTLRCVNNHRFPKFARGNPFYFFKATVK